MLTCICSEQPINHFFIHFWDREFVEKACIIIIIILNNVLQKRMADKDDANRVSKHTKKKSRSNRFQPNPSLYPIWSLREVIMGINKSCQSVYVGEEISSSIDSHQSFRQSR